MMLYTSDFESPIVSKHGAGTGISRVYIAKVITWYIGWELRANYQTAAFLVTPGPYTHHLEVTSKPLKWDVNSWYHVAGTWDASTAIVC